ncbi:ribosomal protein S5 domain 2-like protein [Dentipellis sp. KUC8613]|nr:ribosomal protein S5 domain 2-like protein [Dentipellis sp. KUC8613]
MRPPSPSIPEKEFLVASLAQNLRIDGRSLLEMRPVSFAFGSELGDVECALGKTRVLAHIDAKMVRPPPERPYEGIITIHSEISPMASSLYEPGRPSEEEVALSRMLDKVLRRSDTVDKEALCVLAGQRVWHLRLTIHCLADAGNLQDCACIAGIAALKHFRRPEVEVVGDEIIVHPPTSRAPVPLAMHHTPLNLTFAFFPDASTSSSDAPVDTTYPDGTVSSRNSPVPQMLLDPSPLESTLASSTLALALNSQRELCVVHKAGGMPLSPADVLRAVNVATDRVRELVSRIDGDISTDWNLRGVEVR